MPMSELPTPVRPDGENLRQQERFIAATSETSAMPGEAARIILDLPEDVTELTIVDLASGGSSLTALLLGEGADAYAVDQLYRDRKKIRTALDQSLKKVLKQVPREDKQHMERVTRQSQETFLRSLAANPDRYRAGWLSHLPFHDDFSDWTVSINGISGLGKSYPLLRKATMEALRITKPGGTVVVAPFHTTHGFHQTYSLQFEHLVEELSEQIDGEIEIRGPFAGYADSQLRIMKTPSQ